MTGLYYNKIRRFSRELLCSWMGLDIIDFLLISLKTLWFFFLCCVSGRSFWTFTKIAVRSTLRCLLMNHIFLILIVFFSFSAWLRQFGSIIGLQWVSQWRAGGFWTNCSPSWATQNSFFFRVIQPRCPNTPLQVTSPTALYKTV